MSVSRKLPRSDDVCLWFARLCSPWASTTRETCIWLSVALPPEQKEVKFLNTNWSRNNEGSHGANLYNFLDSLYALFTVRFMMISVLLHFSLKFRSNKLWTITMYRCRCYLGSPVSCLPKSEICYNWSCIIGVVYSHILPFFCSCI